MGPFICSTAELGCYIEGARPSRQSAQMVKGRPRRKWKPSSTAEPLNPPTAFTHSHPTLHNHQVLTPFNLSGPLPEDSEHICPLPWLWAGAWSLAFTGSPTLGCGLQPITSSMVLGSAPPCYLNQYPMTVTFVCQNSEPDGNWRISHYFLQWPCILLALLPDGHKAPQTPAVAAACQATMSHGLPPLVSLQASPSGVTATNLHCALLDRTRTGKGGASGRKSKTSPHPALCPRWARN